MENKSSTIPTTLTTLGKILIDIHYILFLYIRTISSIVKRLILPQKQKSLDGETLLITGAASGVGRLVSCQISEKYKCTLVLWDVDKAGLKKTAQMCLASGATVHWFVVDLTDPVQISATASKVRRDVGHVTILFNNAGVLSAKPFLEEDPNRDERTIRVNLLSYMHMTREFLPQMINKGKGHIVATCSAICFYRMRSLAAYSASKNGLKGFMDTLRLEMALHPEKPDIAITTIYPGWMDTPMAADFHFVKPRYNLNFMRPIKPELVAAKIVKGIELGRAEVLVPSTLNLVELILRFLPEQFINDLENYLCPNLNMLGRTSSSHNDRYYKN